MRVEKQEFPKNYAVYVFPIVPGDHTPVLSVVRFDKEPEDSKTFARLADLLLRREWGVSRLTVDAMTAGGRGRVIKALMGRTGHGNKLRVVDFDWELETHFYVYTFPEDCNVEVNEPFML